MQKYKSNITSTTGAAIRNVPVTVLTEAGELASLFLDRAGAIAAPNPLSTDSSGNFYFYAVNGRYSLRTTVEGITITDDDVVLLQDPAEITVAGPIAEAVAAAKAAAKQAQDAVEASGIPELVAAAQNAVVDADQALQEARSASQASASAKQAAESAQAAAEVAQRDAQAASITSGEASEQAASAAQAAAQSAAAIDPTSIYQAISEKVDAQPGAGLMTDAERQKLGGVAAGATKNATDAQLRDRSSHTGKQPIASVDGLQEALDTAVQETSETGAALLPEGTDAQRPAAEGIPAGHLVVRGNTQDAGDYKPEFWDRVAGAWRYLATRTWVKAITDPLEARARGLGDGQTWQVVTRSPGVTYTNTTGRPIDLKANAVGTSAALGVYASINGSANIQFVSGSSGTGPSGGSGSIVIPKDATYVITLYQVTTLGCLELR